jgi:hypothetical protein
MALCECALSEPLAALNVGDGDLVATVEHHARPGTSLIGTSDSPRVAVQLERRAAMTTPPARHYSRNYSRPAVSHRTGRCCDMNPHHEAQSRDLHLRVARGGSTQVSEGGSEP